MVRVLIYLALVGLFALGAVWIVDRPGELLLTWQGYRVETSVAVAVAFVAAVAGATVILWNVMRWIIGGPEAFSQFRRSRKRTKGYEAIARGVVAVGTGDARQAGREASEARRLLGKEPLTLVLAAQAAQLSGDRAGAEAAFRAMMEKPETRALGLRGLFVEAERRGDRAAAKQIAEDAVRQSPETPWAGQALFEFQCAERDWAGALSTLERLSANRLVEKTDAKRRRAVLLTAQAAAGEGDAALSLRRAREAHGLAPDFVPAATLAARLLAEQSEPRKAQKIVETTWAKAPHPDLAEIYVHVRPGDAARDKLKRARQLAERSGEDPEGQIAVARAAIAAREFDVARSALDRLVASRPTARACLLMAELEDLQNGDSGSARQWLGRALRAPRDSVWVADGVTSETWAPTSPVTGRLDAFVWKTPVEETRPKLAADAWLDQAPREAMPLETSAPTSLLPRRMPELSDPDGKPAGTRVPETGVSETRAPEPRPAPAVPVAVAKSELVPAPKPEPVVETKAEAPAAAIEVIAPPPPSARATPSRPTAAVFPLSRAPDDPGPNGAEPADSSSRGFPANRPTY